MALYFNPMDNLLRLQRDIDRFFGKPQFDLGLSGPSVFPQTNVFVDGNGAFVVRAEVPGIRPDDIHVDVESRRLTITGERRSVAPEKGAVHRCERSSGRFSRALQLPQDLAVDEAKATVRDGLLTVVIPKRQDARPRRIDVAAA